MHKFYSNTEWMLNSKNTFVHKVHYCVQESREIKNKQK